MTHRCPWPLGDDLMVTYHDEEWGVPVHDDRKHFEFLTLDAFQAGLSWSLIMKKREHFRSAFDNFQPARISRYTTRKVDRLLKDAGIIRNRQKILATIGNARAFLAAQEEHGSFDRFVWQFVAGTPIQNRWRSLKQIPSTSIESDRMSKALRECGFKFVGSTICYAYMQAAGMVNDHLTTCFRYREIQGLTA